ncbi:MAG TPA: hypothetical protein VNJ70_13225 [Thermoanaerobaculia bacterium]|nr:hypothetical protein [Thermoanaerobaculia bacterium]
MSGAAVERDLFLALPDQAFDRPSWHGTNLRGSLRRLDPAAPLAVFAEPAGKGRFTVREWVTGIAAHDLYHAGQVQLLKRLAAPAAETGA